MNTAVWLCCKAANNWVGWLASQISTRSARVSSSVQRSCRVVVRVNGDARRVTIGPEPVKLAFDGAFERFELDRNFYMLTERLDG